MSGNFAVAVDDAGGVSVALPGVVDVDVDVAGVAHAGGDEEVGGVADVFVGDFAGEEVPAIPAHGGCGGGGGFGLIGGDCGEECESERDCCEAHAG